MILTILLLLFIVALLVVIGFLCKALSIQVRKNEIYEQWIVELQNKVDEVQQTMTILDDRQMFSKDDEVGAVFQQIVDLVASLNEITAKE
jgi:hypothetical protein